MNLRGAIELNAAAHDGVGKRTICSCMDGYKKFQASMATDKMSAFKEKFTKVMAKAPAGWEETVKHMKDDHPEIDNPWALTHWMKDQGYHSHFEDGGDKK